MEKKVIKVRDLEKSTDLEHRVKAMPKSSQNRVVMKSGSVLNKSVLTAKTKAEEMLGDAEQDAVQIRHEAEEILAQVEEARSEAKREGFEKGKEEGLATATELMTKFEHMKESFYTNAEPDIIRLVMSIAEKVIGKMVQEQDEVIRSVVSQAIESALGDRIVVRLNPADMEKVKEEKFTDILDRTRRVIFKADETITVGGCMVETEVGTVDARLETQLQAIMRALEL